AERANRVLQSVQLDESRDTSADGPGGTRRIQGSLDNIAAGIAHRIAETEWFLGLRIGEKSQKKRSQSSGPIMLRSIASRCCHVCSELHRARPAAAIRSRSLSSLRKCSTLLTASGTVRNVAISRPTLNSPSKSGLSCVRYRLPDIGASKSRSLSATKSRQWPMVPDPRTMRLLAKRRG